MATQQTASSTTSSNSGSATATPNTDDATSNGISNLTQASPSGSMVALNEDGNPYCARCDIVSDMMSQLGTPPNGGFVDAATLRTLLANRTLFHKALLDCCNVALTLRKLLRIRQNLKIAGAMEGHEEAEPSRDLSRDNDGCPPEWQKNDWLEATLFAYDIDDRHTSLISNLEIACQLINYVIPGHLRGIN